MNTQEGIHILSDYLHMPDEYLEHFYHTQKISTFFLSQKLSPPPLRNNNFPDLYHHMLI